MSKEKKTDQENKKNTNIKKKEVRRLGRGLDAIITGNDDKVLKDDGQNGIRTVDVKAIEPNPYQPRQVFDMESLVDLADSIREKGVLQPLIVKKAQDDKYTLIIGERRLRAAKIAGLKKIPVIEKEVSDQDMLELAVLENIQREDLSPVEEAQGYHQLVHEFDISMKELGEKLGKSTSYISNKIRLLKLSPEVMKTLQSEEISEGHARALLGIESKSLQIHAMRLVVRKDLNVRQTEELVRRLKETEGKDRNMEETRKMIKRVLSKNAKYVQNQIEDHFGLPARVVPLSSGGKIIIRYKDEDDLQGLKDQLRRD
jgi:ParB family transcriptional regulator, chromosome partitioning protein